MNLNIIVTCINLLKECQNILEGDRILGSDPVIYCPNISPVHAFIVRTLIEAIISISKNEDRLKINFISTPKNSPVTRWIVKETEDDEIENQIPAP